MRKNRINLTRIRVKNRVTLREILESQKSNIYFLSNTSVFTDILKGHGATTAKLRPNAGPQVRRWQVCKSARMTTQNAHEKRAKCGAAPAASPAGHVGRRVARNVVFIYRITIIFYILYKDRNIIPCLLLP